MKRTSVERVHPSPYAPVVLAPPFREYAGRGALLLLAHGAWRHAKPHLGFGLCVWASFFVAAFLAVSAAAELAGAADPAGAADALDAGADIDVALAPAP